MHVQVSKINLLELLPKQCSAEAVSTALQSISIRTHQGRVTACMKGGCSLVAEKFAGVWETLSSILSARKTEPKPPS